MPVEDADSRFHEPATHSKQRGAGNELETDVDDGDARRIDRGVFCDGGSHLKYDTIGGVLLPVRHVTADSGMIEQVSLSRVEVNPPDLTR